SAATATPATKPHKRAARRLGHRLALGAGPLSAGLLRDDGSTTTGLRELCDASKTSPRVPIPPADPYVAQAAVPKPIFELLTPEVEGDRSHQVIEDDVVVPPKAE